MNLQYSATYSIHTYQRRLIFIDGPGNDFFYIFVSASSIKIRLNQNQAKNQVSIFCVYVIQRVLTHTASNVLLRDKTTQPNITSIHI